MNHENLTTDQRVKKLEIESDWRHRQIGILVDAICSLLTYDQRMALYDKLDSAYNATIAKIETSSNSG